MLWLIILELLILLSWLAIKLTVSIFYSGNNPESYFAHYLYNSFFKFSLAFIPMFAVLALFTIHYKIIDYKSRRSFKTLLFMNGLRIARVGVVLFMLLMCISMGGQMQEDRSAYKANGLLSTTITISDFKLSDGTRTSNSVLPCQIQTDKGVYYLYTKSALHRESSYAIQYFINHKDEKIVLGMKRQ